MSATVATGFASIANHQPHLFQVNPNIPAGEALEQASLLLAAAYDMAHEVAQLDVGNDVWGMACLIEMAKAVVDSVSGGLIRSGGVQ
jgi:formaldehyde-activating enzyme involved in methanogenesis